MAGGRPTKYNDEMQAKADAYVDGGFEDCGDVVPIAAGLSCELRVNTDTLYEWARVNPRFSETMKRLMKTQERLLVAKGLTSTTNTVITKLLLSNHGYSEKTQTDLISTDGSMKPTVIEIVAAKGGDDA